MKNIAILTSCLTRGGAERAAGQLSVNMSKYANVYLFVLEKKEITYAYEGTIINLGFEECYKRLREKKLGFILSKFAYIKTIKEIRTLKRKYKIDTCVSFLEILNIMNLMSKDKEKTVLSIRNNRSMQNNTKLLKFENWFIKRFYKKADKIVAVSYGIQEDLITNFGIPADKIETVYNYFDIQNMQERARMDIPEQYKELYKNRVLISMGRYVEQKNFKHLILSLKNILHSYSDVILVILGKGSLKTELEKIIKDNNLEQKVFLIDYLPNPMPLIKNASAFIMNSTFEGICNSIVESMVCGTVTLSADCKFGPREMMTGLESYIVPQIDDCVVVDRGILYPVNNGNALEKSVKMVLDNPEEFAGLRENALNFFDDSFNQSVDEKWRNLLGVNEL